jgi:hypothetical protein
MPSRRGQEKYLPFFWGGGDVRGGNRPQCVPKNNHASYFVGISFKPLSGHQLPDCFFWFSSVPLRQIEELYLNMVHDHFLPHSLQMSSHQSPYRYGLTLTVWANQDSRDWISDPGNFFVRPYSKSWSAKNIYIGFVLLCKTLLCLLNERNTDQEEKTFILDGHITNSNSDLKKCQSKPHISRYYT